MTLPTIHLNGTSVESLLEDNDKAYRALDLALSAMRQSAPNGRDYYPQSPSAINSAIDEHQERMRKVYEVMKELETMGEHLATEQEKRRKR